MAYKYTYIPGPMEENQLIACRITASGLDKLIQADDSRILERIHNQETNGGTLILSEPLENFTDYNPDWESIIDEGPYV